MSYMEELQKNGIELKLNHTESQMSPEQLENLVRERAKKAERDSRDNFLRARATQEMQVQNWGEKLAKVDLEVLGDLVLPQPFTLQNLIPELFKDNPDPEVYAEQYEACSILLAEINKRIWEYEKEGVVKCLQPYQVLASRPL